MTKLSLNANSTQIRKRLGEKERELDRGVRECCRQYPQRYSDLRGGQADSRCLPHDLDHVFYYFIDPLRSNLSGVDVPGGLVQDGVASLNDFWQRGALLPSETEEPTRRGPRLTPGATCSGGEERRGCALEVEGGEGFTIGSAAAPEEPAPRTIPAARGADEGTGGRCGKREQAGGQAVDDGVHCRGEAMQSISARNGDWAPAVKSAQKGTTVGESV